MGISRKKKKSFPFSICIICIIYPYPPLIPVLRGKKRKRNLLFYREPPYLSRLLPRSIRYISRWTVARINERSRHRWLIIIFGRSADFIIQSSNGRDKQSPRVLEPRSARPDNDAPLKPFLLNPRSNREREREVIRFARRQPIRMEPRLRLKYTTPPFLPSATNRKNSSHHPRNGLLVR